MLFGLSCILSFYLDSDSCGEEGLVLPIMLLYGTTITTVFVGYFLPSVCRLIIGVVFLPLCLCVFFFHASNVSRSTSREVAFFIPLIDFDSPRFLWRPQRHRFSERPERLLHTFIDHQTCHSHIIEKTQKRKHF